MKGFPILVSGLAGIPGLNAFYYFKRQNIGSVFGLCAPHQHQLNESNILYIEAGDRKGLEKLFRQYNFETVIDASGCCALKSCEYNKELSYRLNVEYGSILAELSKKYNAKLFRFSTDLVFDGVGNGNYSESSKVSPLTVYGQHMLEAEKKILSINPKVTIFRIALPMGHALSGHVGAIDWIESRFKKNKFATLYYDEIRSNAYIIDIVRTVDYFIQNVEKCPTDLFHLGGPISLSLYQIAQVINVVGNYAPKLLKGCFRIEDPSIVPRAGNVTMDSSKITALLPSKWITPWPIDVKLIPTSRDWHYIQERPVLSRVQELLCSKIVM